MKQRACGGIGRRTVPSSLRRICHLRRYLNGSVMTFCRLYAAFESERMRIVACSTPTNEVFDL